LAQSEVVLTRNQRDLIDWFHEFTFIETLQFKFESLTRNGCRVVLLNYDGSSVTSNEPTVHGSVASGGINFNEMGLLKRKNALESDGIFSCNTDLLDSVVIKAYLPQSNPDPRHYMVTSTDGNPSSEFPDPDKAKTFKEYYERNYDIKIMDLSQPLVEVIPHSRDIDCRSGKGKSDKPKERLIPELLKFRTSSQSLTLRALLLPTILYRINSLVSMSQLQDSVVREITNASCIDNTPEPPAKRLKLLTLSCVKERNSNDTTMVEPFQSLSKYFYPFDNSKSVPLLQLLEAMTCASSRDNFDLERLEMLGDSFLKIAVSVHVYWHKNHKDEGKLTKYRTRQISNKKLFELANKRQLPKYIKHSVFSKQTWFPPGFTSPQSKVENGNSSCCGDHDFDVSTHDVIHDDVVHDNAMQDDAAGDAMCEEGSEDVVYNGATGDVIHDDAMHEDASDNVVNKNVTNNVMNNDFDSYYVMRQEIPDKSVADSMEALIGAHLVHCGYMGALRFMTWLGLDVFHSENTENRKLTNNYRRRKSSQCKSKYANYPLPTLDIPADESNERYEQLLDEHTKEMASFEEKIGYTFKNKV
jgi:dsRNA-specific ribonuclease